MQRHRRARLEQLAVDGRQDAHVVVGAGGGGDDAVVVVDDLEELADDKRDGLDAFDLLLGSHEFALQVLHLVLDVLLLDLQELELPLQHLHLRVEVGAAALGAGGSGQSVRRLAHLHHGDGGEGLGLTLSYILLSPVTTTTRRKKYTRERERSAARCFFHHPSREEAAFAGSGVFPCGEAKRNAGPGGTCTTAGAARERVEAERAVARERYAPCVLRPHQEREPARR